MTFFSKTLIFLINLWETLQICKINVSQIDGMDF